MTEVRTMMKSCLLAALLLGVSCAAESKCISLSYTVTGLVTDTSGAPVVNAQVTVSSPPLSRTEQFHTNLYGRYTATILISPGDDLPDPARPNVPTCSRRLAAATVEVAANGFELVRQDVRFDGLADTPREGFTATLSVTLQRATADHVH